MLLSKNYYRKKKLLKMWLLLLPHRSKVWLSKKIINLGLIVAAKSMKIISYIEKKRTKRQLQSLPSRYNNSINEIIDKI